MTARHKADRSPDPDGMLRTGMKHQLLQETPANYATVKQEVLSWLSSHLK